MKVCGECRKVTNAGTCPNCGNSSKWLKDTPENRNPALAATPAAPAKPKSRAKPIPLPPPDGDFETETPTETPESKFPSASSDDNQGD